MMDKIDSLETDNGPIMVATDLRPQSDRAIDRAIMTADAQDVRLIVFHVIEEGSRLAATPERTDAAVRSVLPDPAAAVEIRTAEGSAPSKIVEAAEVNGCSLIVTGVARFNSLGDSFIGTAVERVVRKAAQPVLVVKQRPRANYRNMVAATDFSACSRHALLTAARLFPEAKLHVFHAFHVAYEGFVNIELNVDDVRAEVQSEFDDFLNDPVIPDEIRRRVTSHLEYGDTQGVADQLVDKLEADLVVIGTHGRSGFSKAAFGSIAEMLLRSVPVDTLVVREPV
jgi:nucleotide-binding universal stress UspA family protein